MELLTVAAKLAFAVVFGGVVGWQREARDRPAGLRTHVLVCVGSTVYTLASLGFTGPTADPGRVAAQVATGMGFLGAGTIIRHGNVVRGLTTAASLWAVAAIGLCVGLGGPALWVAALATLIVMLTLSVLRLVEVRLLSRDRIAHITVQLAGGPGRTDAVRTALRDLGAAIESVEVTEVGPGEVQQLQLRVVLPANCDIAAVGPRLTELQGFVSMRCE
jgi:putative Mg2+ transporter-C (MgtC) family protein